MSADINALVSKAKERHGLARARHHDGYIEAHLFREAEGAAARAIGCEGHGQEKTEASVDGAVIPAREVNE